MVAWFFVFHFLIRERLVGDEGFEPPTYCV